MDIITLTLFIGDLLAPALAMGLALSFINVSAESAPAVLGRRARFFANTLVGCIVLIGGLIYFGEDGKMATYALLVLCVAASQWFLTRGWHWTEQSGNETDESQE